MNTAPPGHVAHPLVARLERSIALTEAERSAIIQVPVHQAVAQPDAVILRADDKPSSSFLLTQGVACSSKAAADGRQITSFFIRGDLPDLHSLHLEVLDSDIWAMTECHLAFMAHADLRRLCHAHPRVGDELWRHTLVAGAIYREWVVNLGQRQALSRLAHVFCEMMLRSEAAGLAQGGSCPLPITQGDLGEATGLSVVHVNRTLQELRGQGLLTFERGTLTIHDWPALVEIADFRPDYLHLRKAEALVH